MDALPASEWKHATCDRHPLTEVIAVVLFDDEFDGQDTIYQRFSCGSLFPARSVTRADSAHHARVIAAWAARAPVDDRRTMSQT